MIHKAFPAILRDTPAPAILAFEHPTAGLQFVKGTVEDGETPPLKFDTATRIARADRARHV